MAFVAGSVGRAAAGRAAGGAAARGAASKGAARGAASKGASKGSGSAFGTAARAKADPELAAQLAELNGDTPAPKPAPAPAPEPAPEPAAKPSSPGSPASGAGAAFRKLSSSSEGTPGFYRRAEKLSSPTVVANAGGGALLGLVAYMVGLTYLRDGRAGVTALFRAKFLNQTSTRSAS